MDDRMNCMAQELWIQLKLTVFASTKGTATDPQLTGQHQDTYKLIAFHLITQRFLSQKEKVSKHLSTSLEFDQQQGGLIELQIGFYSS